MFGDVDSKIINPDVHPGAPPLIGQHLKITLLKRFSHSKQMPEKCATTRRFFNYNHLFAGPYQGYHLMQVLSGHGNLRWDGWMLEKVVLTIHSSNIKHKSFINGEIGCILSVLCVVSICFLYSTTAFDQEPESFGSTSHDCI